MSNHLVSFITGMVDVVTGAEASRAKLEKEAKDRAKAQAKIEKAQVKAEKDARAKIEKDARAQVKAEKEAQAKIEKAQVKGKPEEERTKTVLYVYTSDDDRKKNYYKIGITTDLDSLKGRLCSLNTSKPEPGYFAKTWVVKNARVLEMDLHKHFEMAGLKQEKEWVRANHLECLLALIDKYVACMAALDMDLAYMAKMMNS